MLKKELGGMGFQNIRVFNLALLGKQGWSLINKPNSLVARVLKARYYPQIDFIYVSIETNSSYSWMSIWTSRAVVKEGIGWRISNGNRVCVWQDLWLKNDVSSLARILMHVVDPHLMVNDLIDVGQGCWNNRLEKACMHHDDAQNVKRIPLVDTSRGKIW